MTLMHGDNSSHIWRRNARPEHHIFPPVFHPLCPVGGAALCSPSTPLLASSTPAAIFSHYLLILASTSYIHTQIDREISTYNIVYSGWKITDFKAILHVFWFNFNKTVCSLPWHEIKHKIKDWETPALRLRQHRTGSSVLRARAWANTLSLLVVLFAPR